MWWWLKVYGGRSNSQILDATGRVTLLIAGSPMIKSGTIKILIQDIAIVYQIKTRRHSKLVHNDFGWQTPFYIADYKEYYLFDQKSKGVFA